MFLMLAWNILGQTHPQNTIISATGSAKMRRDRMKLLTVTDLQFRSQCFALAIPASKMMNKKKRGG